MTENIMVKKKKTIISKNKTHKTKYLL